jgi:hypothetical protein
MNMPEQQDLLFALQNIACFEHRVKPVVSVSDNSIALKCCCEDFYFDCLLVSKDLAEMLNLKDLKITRH